MRQIGSIPNEPQAVRFGDYLLTLGIGNSVEESPPTNQWAVWVEHDDHLDRASAELATFLTNPNDPRYTAAVKVASTVRAEQERAEKRRQKQFVDVRTRWSQPNQWNVPMTLGLIVFSIIVALLTKFESDNGQYSGSLYIARVVYHDEYVSWQPGLQEIRHGEVWRLITPIFLHANILHILFNMLWLRDLGGMIERRKGSWFFAGLVLVIAVLSNLLQFYYKTPHNPLFGGMSGVVFGLFGYVWIRGRLDPAGGIGIAPQSAGMMFIWLFLCMTGLVGPIANGAHVGGLIVGLAFAYIPHTLKRLLR